jgi:hypothetical protein
MPGIQWNSTQRRIAESILRHLREDNSYDSKLVSAEVPDVGLSTITKVYNALKKNNFIIPPLFTKKIEEKVSKNIGSDGISSTEQPAGGVVTFEIHGKKVVVEADDYLKCYDDFLDLQQIIGWKADFSSTVREGMKMFRGVMVNLLSGRDVGTEEVQNQEEDEDEGDDDAGGQDNPGLET